MSEFSSSAVEQRTNLLSGFAQVLTALGFVVIILGAVLLIITLIQEFGGDDTEFQTMEVVESAALLFYGLMLAGIGSGLQAIRSIAVNCAKLVEKG